MSSANKSASATNEMTFRRTPATKTIFDFADENRIAGRFSDVTINVKQQTIPANKIILAYILFEILRVQVYYRNE